MPHKYLCRFDIAPQLRRHLRFRLVTRIAYDDMMAHEIELATAHFFVSYSLFFRRHPSDPILGVCLKCEISFGHQARLPPREEVKAEHK